MTSSEARRMLTVRLATFFAYRAGLLVCRPANSDPTHKIVCVNCGTTYERVKYQ